MALAKWWRIDFHTHTPASKCFKNSKAINTYDEDRKIEEAKKWLLKAKENKLDAVAITDHNSVAWIDRIRKAKEKLKTFDRRKYYRHQSRFPCFELLYGHQRMAGRGTSLQLQGDL